MPFPIFEMPFIGNGMAIGLDAITHVLFSHGIAIGTFALIVLSEYLGWKRTSPEWERFAHDLLKFAAILITGIGAILGVGIWLVTSTLEPRGIASLLRVFFWPWFVEWISFTSEVVLLLFYYFTWDRWNGERKKRHMLLGIGYVLFAISSAFIISGILGFMLTSDGWPWNEGLLSAFFNPTFAPQFLLRLSAAYTLGVVVTTAYLMFTPRTDQFRREALPIFGKIGLLTLSGVLVFGTWYFAAVPATFKQFAIYAVVTALLSQHPELFWAINLIGGLLFVVFLMGIASRHTRLARVLVLPVLLVGIWSVTEFERMREFIRGPYIIPGYMYANQVMLDEQPFFSEQGLLANSYWFNAANRTLSPQDQGAYLFAQNCSACHTIGGLNDIAARVQGRTADAIFVIIAHTHEMVPFMAPFSGTVEERQILANYLFQLSNGSIQHGTPSRFYNLPAAGSASTTGAALGGGGNP